MAAKRSKQTYRSTMFTHTRVWGLSLAITGGLLFGLAASSLISQSLLYGFDQQFSSWFSGLRGQSSPAQVDFLKLLGQLGSDGTTIFALGLVAFNLFRKNTRQLLLLLIGVGGSEILWLLLIFVFDRSRPKAVSGFGGLELPSFPSGHAMLVVTVFILLLYMYSRGLPSRLWGLAFAAFVFIWASLTGAIRLFLNVHFFTDVLAGYGLGLAWTGLTILLVDGYILQSKQDKRVTRQPTSQ